MIRVQALQNFYSDAVGSKAMGETFDVADQQTVQNLEQAGYVRQVGSAEVDINTAMNMERQAQVLEQQAQQLRQQAQQAQQSFAQVNQQAQQQAQQQQNAQQANVHANEAEQKANARAKATDK